MDAFKLTACTVQELSQQELSEVNGGMKIFAILGMVDTTANDKWQWFWELI